MASSAAFRAQDEENRKLLDVAELALGLRMNCHVPDVAKFV
jgi:hypothetical protein